MKISNRLILEASNLGFEISKLGVVSRRGKKLKCSLTKGYLRVNVRFEGRSSVPLKVHRLQAYVKFGFKLFEEGIVVRHLNGVKTDNSWANIAIGTPYENSMDRPKSERVLNASNPKHDHALILEDRRKGMTYKELMDKYKISSKGTISFIINKSLKRH